MLGILCWSGFMILETFLLELCADCRHNRLVSWSSSWAGVTSTKLVKIASHLALLTTMTFSHTFSMKKFVHRRWMGGPSLNVLVVLFFSCRFYHKIYTFSFPLTPFFCFTGVLTSLFLVSEPLLTFSYPINFQFPCLNVCRICGKTFSSGCSVNIHVRIP